MTETYKWHEVYKAALLETDWTKIEREDPSSGEGIGARLHEFSLNHGGTPEENQAIVDALHGLDILRKEVAAWRDRSGLVSLSPRQPCRGRML